MHVYTGFICSSIIAQSAKVVLFYGVPLLVKRREEA
jgi:hypothetical protein